MRRLMGCLSLAMIGLLPVATMAVAQQPGPGLLVVETDFGTADGAVAAMKGVALGVDPTLVIHDLTHEIPPFDIWTGAFQLASTVPFWPAGTVFVAVVDPGVGTDRPAVVLRTLSDHLIVAPDNGLLTLVAERQGIAEVRWIDVQEQRRADSSWSYTFDGRDVFALVGARLAAGELTLDTVGPALAPQVRMLDYPRPALADGAATGMIPALDSHFGNVWTNIPARFMDELGIARGQPVAVVIRAGERLVFEGEAPFVNTFADVPEGAPLAYVNSQGEMAMALNLGSFAAAHGIGFGPDWRVELRRPGS